MADIDKVIEGLKYCQKAACVSYKGHKCPYIGSEYGEGCICEMQNDALEVLKEVANMKETRMLEYPAAMEFQGAKEPEDVVCMECEHVFSSIDTDVYEYNYCPYCGAKIIRDF